jgi:hypothetical protein
MQNFDRANSFDQYEKGCLQMLNFPWHLINYLKKKGQQKIIKNFS